MTNPEILEALAVCEKATKGPWRVDIRTGMVAIYAGDRVNCLTEADGWAICVMQGHGQPYAGGYRLMTDEQCANARLIGEACNHYAEVLQELLNARKRIAGLEATLAQRQKRLSLPRRHIGQIQGE